MKHLSDISALTTVLLASGAICLTSCSAMWDTSLSDSPYNNYYGWDGEWLPSLTGTPLLSPYYYGGSAYPIINWHPVYRPGTGPTGIPVAPPAVIVPNRPGGNVRPPQTPAPTPPAQSRH